MCRQKFLVLTHVHTLAEQQGNAPRTCQRNDCVDDAAEQAVLTAEKPCDQIKLEQTHQTPVQGTHDGKNQCNSIHVITSTFLLDITRFPADHPIIHTNWLKFFRQLQNSVSFDIIDRKFQFRKGSFSMNAFLPADILLPRDADLQKWAVIACDQFTSDPAYWQRVRAAAGDAPSTVNLIIPEAELDHHDAAVVEKINDTMLRYQNEGLFALYPNSFIYVERTLENGTVRPGLVGMVDLECYDYSHGSGSAIRATEMTVLERIPPRKMVRKDASLELPHVLMLCDDDQKELIEPIAAIKNTLPVVYDLDLMEQGGHITGWLVQGEAADAFNDRLSTYSKTYEAKYADLDGAKVLLAVGDGNHSLATAKSCYEDLKAQNPGVDLSAHPARYALVELENIHDPSLSFEPIHRVVFDVDREKLLADLNGICAENGFPVSVLVGNEQKTVYLDKNRGELAVAILQEFLDDWFRHNPGKIDYIHGEAEVAELAKRDNAVGFLLSAMGKNELFRGVIAGGVLPRKTFSMGHAREKRYYMEGRRIK